MKILARMGWKFLLMHHFHVHFELHWMAYSRGSHEWKLQLPPPWRERCPVALPQELEKPQIQSGSSEPLWVLSWLGGNLVSKFDVGTYIFWYIVVASFNFWTPKPFPEYTCSSSQSVNCAWAQELCTSGCWAGWGMLPQRQQRGEMLLGPMGWDMD